MKRHEGTEKSAAPLPSPPSQQPLPVLPALRSLRQEALPQIHLEPATPDSLGLDSHHNMDASSNSQPSSAAAGSPKDLQSPVLSPMGAATTTTNTTNIPIARSPSPTGTHPQHSLCDQSGILRRRMMRILRFFQCVLAAILITTLAIIRSQLLPSTTATTEPPAAPTPKPTTTTTAAMMEFGLAAQGVVVLLSLLLALLEYRDPPNPSWNAASPSVVVSQEHFLVPPIHGHLQHQQYQQQQHLQHQSAPSRNIRFRVLLGYLALALLLALFAILLLTTNGSMSYEECLGTVGSGIFAPERITDTCGAPLLSVKAMLWLELLLWSWTLGMSIDQWREQSLN